MKFLYAVLTSLGSICALFLFTKIIGNKQMSELNMFDYINGITIGSIASEMAITADGEFIFPLIAMIVYTLVAIIITIVTNKSIALRRLISGKAIILIDNGKIFKENFSRARLDLGEFLAQCRINGYFNVSDIRTAILEANGSISILPKASARPVNLTDLDMKSEDEKLVVNIIQDGKILQENLKYCGRDERWLKKTLKSQGIRSEKNVFLATCDSSGNVSVFEKYTEAPKEDLFE